MVFEKAVENDISALIEMRKEYLLEDYEKLPKDSLEIISKNLFQYFKKHLNKDLTAFVCRHNGEIISCCLLCIMEKPPNPTFVNGKTGTVMNVYTKPEYRKRGISGRLLGMLLAESEKERLDFVELKATDSGYKLYKSVGFKETKSRYRNMKYVIDPANRI